MHTTKLDTAALKGKAKTGACMGCDRGDHETLAIFSAGKTFKLHDIGFFLC